MTFPTTKLNWFLIFLGDVDFENKDELKRLKGLPKLNFILSLHERIPEEIKTLTISSQNLLSKTLKPVKKCLDNHFKGNKEEFLKCFGQLFAHSRFNDSCSTK